MDNKEQKESIIVEEKLASPEEAFDLLWQYIASIKDEKEKRKVAEMLGPSVYFDEKTKEIMVVISRENND